MKEERKENPEDLTDNDRKEPQDASPVETRATGKNCISVSLLNQSLK